MADDITADNWHIPRYDEQGRDHRMRLAIRFTGGRYNGLKGNLQWIGEVWASVMIEYDHKLVEVMEELRHMVPIALWKAGKTETELSLRDT